MINDLKANEREIKEQQKRDEQKKSYYFDIAAQIEENKRMNREKVERERKEDLDLLGKDLLDKESPKAKQSKLLSSFMARRQLKDLKQLKEQQQLELNKERMEYNEQILKMKEDAKFERIIIKKVRRSKEREVLEENKSIADLLRTKQSKDKASEIRKEISDARYNERKLENRGKVWNQHFKQVQSKMKQTQNQLIEELTRVNLERAAIESERDHKWIREQEEINCKEDELKAKAKLEQAKLRADFITELDKTIVEHSKLKKQNEIEKRRDREVMEDELRRANREAARQLRETKGRVSKYYVDLKEQMHRKIRTFDVDSMTPTELSINKSYFNF